MESDPGGAEYKRWLKQITSSILLAHDAFLCIKTIDKYWAGTNTGSIVHQQVYNSVELTGNIVVCRLILGCIRNDLYLNLQYA